MQNVVLHRKHHALLNMLDRQPYMESWRSQWIRGPHPIIAKMATLFVLSATNNAAQMSTSAFLSSCSSLRTFTSFSTFPFRWSTNAPVSSTSTHLGRGLTPPFISDRHSFIICLPIVLS